MGIRTRFGEFVLDGSARTLSRADAAVPLSPRAFDLLLLLLEQRPRVVAQAELRDRLWPDTVVAYTSLARLVTEVRQALLDSSEQPRYVRTVYGRGYAFVGDAVEERSRFGLAWAKHDFALVEGVNLVGRGADCQVHVDSARVSRHHARIVVAGDGATIEDLGSKNGTYLNDDRVDAPRALSAGDRVRIGHERLVFRLQTTDPTLTDRNSNTG